MALNSNRLSVNIKDGVGRVSRQRLNILALTAGNFTTVTGDVVAYINALTPLVAGNLYGYDITIPANTTPTTPDKTVQRGTKFVVVGQEAVGNLRYFISTVPACVIDDAHWNADQHYDSTNSDWTAYATAYNALAVSPEGNALTFRDAYLATRRK